MCRMSIYAKNGMCNKTKKECFACPLLICYLVKNHNGECVMVEA